MHGESDPHLGIDIRSYRSDHGAHRHDFAQLVLPLSGALLIDLDGREGGLDTCRGAFVDPGLSHSQMSGKPNRSLIVDIDPGLFSDPQREDLARRPFLELTPPAMRLVEFMGLMLGQGAPPPLGLWVPLLLETLSYQPPTARTRLSGLLAALEAAPGRPWNVEMMAAKAGVSSSRLHALFRAELDDTPLGWLAGLRLARVREGLARSDLSIAELAFRAGYADQSALTRAMRRATGMTPAAYRRQHRQESGPNG